MDKIFGKNRFYKALKNRLIRLLTTSKPVKMRGYSILLNFLKYFGLTEDEYDFRDEKAFNGKDNIFKVCKNSGLDIFYDSFTALNFTKSNKGEGRLQMVEDNIIKNRIRTLHVVNHIRNFIGIKYIDKNYSKEFNAFTARTVLNFCMNEFKSLSVDDSIKIASEKNRH